MVITAYPSSLHVRDVVCRKAAHRARLDGRAGVCAGVVTQVRLCGANPAAAVDADLDLDDCRRRRAGRLENGLPVHVHLDRPAALLRKDGRQRFQIHAQLCAEPAADFQRLNDHIGLGQPQDAGGAVPYPEYALCARPHRHASVLIPARRAGVRLYVALVDRREFHLPLDHDLGLFEPLFDVAHHVPQVRAHVSVRHRLARGGRRGIRDE